MNWFKAWEPQAQSAFISAIIGAVFGLIGGIGGPIIQGRLQQASDLNKLRLENELKRQATIIEAQDTLLSDMTAALWDWRYNSIRICYYGSRTQVEAYDRAWAEYDASIWHHLNKIRSLISQHRRLGSENTYHELRQFYEVVVDLDRDISTAASEINRDIKVKLFSDLNTFIYGDISERIDGTLFVIASDLKLNQANPAR